MEPVRKAKETLGHHDAANTKNNGTDNSSKLSQYNLRDQKNNSQSRGRADTKLANRIDPQAAEEQKHRGDTPRSHLGSVKDYGKNGGSHRAEILNKLDPRVNYG